MAALVRYKMRCSVVMTNDLGGGGELFLNDELPASFERALGFCYRGRAGRTGGSEAKNKVELPVLYERERWCYGRVFVNDADLNAQASVAGQPGEHCQRAPAQHDGRAPRGPLRA